MKGLSLQCCNAHCREMEAVIADAVSKGPPAQGGVCAAIVSPPSMARALMARITNITFVQLLEGQ